MVQMRYGFMRLILIWGFVGSLFWGPEPVQAQTEFWQATGGPTGGSVNQLVVDPGGDVYAVAGNEFYQSLYRSADRGVTWAEVLSVEGGVSRVAITPEGSVFAVTGMGDLLESTDSGVTWQPIDHPGDFIATIEVTSDGSLYTGGGAVYRSVDGGETWESRGLEGPGVHAFAFVDSNTVIAATGMGLYRSMGDDWLRIDSMAYPTALTVMPDSSVIVGLTGVSELGQRSGLYRLEDDSLLTLIGLDGLSIVALVVDGDSTIYAGTSGNNNGFVSFPPAGVYRSNDAGRTWTQSGLISTPVPALAMDAEGTLYAGTQGLFTDTGSLLSRGILYSSDEGNTWTPAEKGLPFARTYGLVSGPEGEVYALANHSVFRTLDQGATWDNVYTDESTLDTPYPPYYKLAVHPEGDLFLLAGHPPRSDGIGFVLYMTGPLLHSTDRGETWTRIEGAPSDVGSMAVTPNGTLLMAAPQGLLRSTDRGQTWVTVEPALPEPYVIDVKTSASDSAYAVAWDPEILTASFYRSADEGATWTLVRSIEGVVVPEYVTMTVDLGGALYIALDYEQYVQASILSLVVTPNRTLYAAGGGLMYRSTDDGLTWETVESTLLADAGIQSLTIDTEGYLYAGTNRSVYRSVSSVLTSTGEEPPVPEQVSVGPNYPNPVDRVTRIPFTLANPSRVSVRIYDLLGREVAVVLNDAAYREGAHEVVWNAAGVPSGTYVYQVRMGGTVRSGSLVVVH